MSEFLNHFIIVSSILTNERGAYIKSAIDPLHPSNQYAIKRCHRRPYPDVFPLVPYLLLSRVYTLASPQ